MKKIKLSLSENALSFFEEALSNAVTAEEHPKRWKFALLSIVQAIELSLKELLRLQHPFLIFKDVDKPSKTVTLDQAILRLQRIANLKITSDDRRAVTFASEVRNNIIHYQIETEITQLKLTFSRLLGFICDFYREHLEYDLNYEINEELWQSGVAIREYGQELYRRAKARLKSEGLNDFKDVITCPKCGWDSLVAFGDHSDTCYVCGNVEELIICERCNKIMLAIEDEESEEMGKIGGKYYCWDCFVYLTDDYWYEQSVGK